MQGPLFAPLFPEEGGHGGPPFVSQKTKQIFETAKRGRSIKALSLFYGTVRHSWHIKMNKRCRKAIKKGDIKKRDRKRRQPSKCALVCILNKLLSPPLLSDQYFTLSSELVISPGEGLIPVPTLVQTESHAPQ